MTIKKLNLTAFFIVLTLSIGLASVNSPLTVKAQNSALLQGGNGDKAEQETEQSQSSEQNNQVVSGDNSILSGNNILCEDQANSDELEVMTGICNSDETNSPPNEQSTVYIWVNVAAGACPPGKCSITAQAPNGGGFFKDDLPSGQSTYTLPVPVGGYFLVQALVNDYRPFEGTQVKGVPTFNLDCLNIVDRQGNWSCNGNKFPFPTRLDISFTR